MTFVLGFGLMVSRSDETPEKGNNMSMNEHLDRLEVMVSDFPNCSLKDIVENIEVYFDWMINNPNDSKELNLRYCEICKLLREKLIPLCYPIS